MTKVHIINHTHWDREWYFSSMDSLVLSDQIFTDVIEELQQHPEVSFVLDGQLSILDEYMSLYPEKMKTVKQLIANQQLFIGPWYTQSDANFVGGEAILRNAMIGIFESKKYGKYMPVGYLPDTFGFNAQMPVILNEVGLDNIVTYRGIDLEKQVTEPYFKWASLGGETQIYAINLPHGYGAGMLLEPSQAYINGRLDPEVDFIKNYSKSDAILVPSGNDQLPITRDLPNKLEKINKLGKFKYIISNYPDFIDEIKKIPLKTYCGEFREPTLARVHKTIGSVRMDIKRAVFDLENKLLYRTEPLLVIAKQMKLNISNRLILLAWKKLLEAQAHDSLAGCVSDPVAEDIRHRLKEADEICISIENIILKELAEQLSLKQTEVLLINPTPKHFKGIKTVKLLSKKANVRFYDNESEVIHTEYIAPREGILEETPGGNRYIKEQGYYILTVRLNCELPGLGYQVFSFEEIDDEKKMKSLTNTKIKGKDVTLEFHNQSVDLHKQDYTIQDFICLTEEGNAGDTYDFSPLEGSEVFNLRFHDCHCYQRKNDQIMILHGSCQLPVTLEDRKLKKYDQTFTYQIMLSIDKNDQISGTINFLNNVDNHRLRLQLKTREVIKHAKAGVPYGFINRKNKSIQSWKQKYAEMPVNVEPFDKTISVLTPTKEIDVFTTDTKEYEYKDKFLWLTLLATTDSLGKPDLVYRPGRASGDTTKKGHVMMDTPDAQLRKQTITFNFHLNINEGKRSEDDLSNWREQLIQPDVSYQSQLLNLFMYRIDNKISTVNTKTTELKRTFSLLELPKVCHVASIYPSYYYQDAFVIRFENPTNKKVQLSLKSLFKGFSFQCVNALEESLPFTDNISPYGVLTILVKFPIAKKKGL